MNKSAKYFLVGAIGLSWVILIIIFKAFSITLSPPLYVVLGGIFIIDMTVIYLILQWKPKEGAFDMASIPPNADLPYVDRLIRIDEQGITIKIYYFPFGARRIHFSDIETVQAYNGGCMRLWGTGDFRRWFGLDWRRPGRAMTFIIIPKRGWCRIGFTAENSAIVAAILRERNLLEVLPKTLQNDF